MQASAQRHIDSAISKTINCPQDITFDAFKDIYLDAYALGLKGITTYRPNGVTGAVLTVTPPPAPPKVAMALSVGNAGAASTLSVVPFPPVSPPAGLHESGDVVYMTAPLKRDAVLSGYTYKLSWPASAHALYITINDTDAGGRRRPFEIFINTKTLEHHAWTVALTRMISAVFRRGGDVSFVVEELKAIVDPQGGSWLDGRYVPSLIAAIGGVIEQHLTRIGAMSGDAGSVAAEREPMAVIEAGHKQARSSAGDISNSSYDHAAARPCPRCSAPAYTLREGCWVCSTCGHSSCG